MFRRRSPSASKALLSNTDSWHSFRAQDLGMLLAGVIAQVQAGDRRWARFIDPLFAFLRERYHAPSGLFFDQPQGFRRRFASFATQTYLTLACYLYGEFTGKPEPSPWPTAPTRKLIALQGPQGEWPWFFDALRGTVLDYTRSIPCISTAWRRPSLSMPSSTASKRRARR